MSFLAELKRRNVFRVGIAYIVGSWLLVQAADLVLDVIGAEEWVLRAVAALLALGLVPALVFAWAFELTPEGLKKESEVDRTRSITRRTGRKLDIVTVVLLVIAIGLVVVDRLLPEPAPQAAAASAETAAAATTEAEPNSIAVLPFSDLSAEGDQAYFSDGIAEELLNLLVRVEGLKVASRTSSFAYRDQSKAIPEIAAELKVANILEGSVRKAGNRVRITAQLIDTRNDRHLWSETFDRELVDIFTIQDEIATAIVTALKNELGVEMAVESIEVDAATSNMDAYDLYLRANSLFIARQSLDEAIRLLERAIELDPQFARAWEGLAAVQRVADDWLIEDGIDHAPAALAAAQRAMELDPDLSVPYAVLGGLHQDGMPGTGAIDLSETERLYGEAIAKDPGNATNWLWRGILFEQLGYLDRAIADFDECLKRDPAYLNCVQHRAAVLLYRGDTEAALAAFTLTMYENFHSITEPFVPVLVERGDSLAAVLLAQARLNAPYAPVGEWITALEQPGADHSAGLARWDRWAADYRPEYLLEYPLVFLAFGAFERAASAEELTFVLFAPAAKAFRQSPYFKEFVRDRGIETYWREHGFPPSCRTSGEQDFACE